jgi:hypothetical protein
MCIKSAVGTMLLSGIMLKMGLWYPLAIAIGALAAKYMYIFIGLGIAGVTDLS